MCMVVVLTWDNVKLMGKFSEAEILKQFKTSMGQPLTCKDPNRMQVVIQRQGRFTKCGSLWLIPSVV